MIVSSIGLVTYVLLLRWFSIDGVTALFPQALGYFLTTLVLTSPRFDPQGGPVDTRWSIITVRQFLPGFIFGAALLIMLTLSAKVGVATGFTLSQMGVVLTHFFGHCLVGGEPHAQRNAVDSFWRRRSRWGCHFDWCSKNP